MVDIFPQSLAGHSITFNLFKHYLTLDISQNVLRSHIVVYQYSFVVLFLNTVTQSSYGLQIITNNGQKFQHSRKGIEMDHMSIKIAQLVVQKFVLRCWLGCSF